MQDWSELYPPFKTVMFGDVELALSHKARLPDADMTDADVAAHTRPAVPPPPGPAITAWRGADLDAYHCDDGDGLWRHCLSGALWSGNPIIPPSEAAA